MNLWKCLWLALLMAVTSRAGELRILCYHDVVATDAEAERNVFSVSSARLARHFAWFRASGWEVVSLDQVMASRQGGAPLPPKSLMLTFDDGYQSHYERVLPLLNAFRYPAVFAIVGSWMNLPPGARVPFDEGSYRREDLLSFEQMKTMARSPWVEFASHGFDCHRGVQANPQGNRIQALIAREWDPVQKCYESPSARSARLENDLRTSFQWLSNSLGKAPKSIVWPFGRYNELSIACAKKAGFQVMFNLDAGSNNEQTPLDRLHRTLITGNPDEAGIDAELSPLPPQAFRAMHVDLDYVYDPSAAQQERNLDALLERISHSGANAVFLQAFADPEGDGTVRSLYFPSRHLPMRADLFSRAAWQIHTRTGARVYAWMPVLSFALPDAHPASKDLVVSRTQVKGAYRRLTPFSPAARQAICEIYEDLASHCTFEGLLFHDDATFSEHEDESTFSVQAWEEAKPRFQNGRARFQEKFLTDFTMELASRVRAWQTGLMTARNLYASVVLDATGPERFGQSLEGFMATYDRVAVMAFPYMEEAKQPLPWLSTLADKMRSEAPDGFGKIVFELQARDWRTGKAVASSMLARQMELLIRKGAIHLAFYPDDFPRQQPDLDVIAPWFSLRRTPGAMAGR